MGQGFFHFHVDDGKKEVVLIRDLVASILRYAPRAMRFACVEVDALEDLNL